MNNEHMQTISRSIYALVGGLTPVHIPASIIEKYAKRRLVIKREEDGSIMLLDADNLDADAQEKPIEWHVQTERMQVLYNVVAAYNRWARSAIDDELANDTDRRIMQALLRKGHNALLWPDDQLPPIPSEFEADDPPGTTEKLHNLNKTHAKMSADYAETTGLLKQLLDTYDKLQACVEEVDMCLSTYSNSHRVLVDKTLSKVIVVVSSSYYSRPYYSKQEYEHKVYDLLAELQQKYPGTIEVEVL